MRYTIDSSQRSYETCMMIEFPCGGLVVYPVMAFVACASLIVVFEVWAVFRVLDWLRARSGRRTISSMSLGEVWQEIRRSK